jgi:hypothetical protein
MVFDAGSNTGCISLPHTNFISNALTNKINVVKSQINSIAFALLKYSYTNDMNDESFKFKL